jgi:hypothetical protein
MRRSYNGQAGGEILLAIKMGKRIGMDWARV